MIDEIDDVPALEAGFVHICSQIYIFLASNQLSWNITIHLIGAFVNIKLIELLYKNPPNASKGR